MDFIIESVLFATDLNSQTKMLLLWKFFPKVLIKHIGIKIIETKKNKANKVLKL